MILSHLYLITIVIVFLLISGLFISFFNNEVRPYLIAKKKLDLWRKGLTPGIYVKTYDSERPMKVVRIYGSSVYLWNVESRYLIVKIHDVYPLDYEFNNQ